VEDEEDDDEEEDEMVEEADGPSERDDICEEVPLTTFRIELNRGRDKREETRWRGVSRGAAEVAVVVGDSAIVGNVSNREEGKY
jgi:hypothetical protein